jgi:hypothetical protein
MGFLFSSDAIFLESRRTVGLSFFDRPYCSNKEHWAFIERHARAMACNWSSAMGMSGGIYP